MSEHAVKENMNQIHAALAKQTGVNVADVAKILNHLGLEGALLNRASKATSDPRTKIVSLDNIRISAGLPGPPL